MRNTKLTIAAIQFLGILAVTACSPRPNQPEAALVQTPTPSLGSVYFPAQYVNQATRIEEQPDAF